MKDDRDGSLVIFNEPKDVQGTAFLSLSRGRSPRNLTNIYPCAACADWAPPTCFAGSVTEYRYTTAYYNLHIV